MLESKLVFCTIRSKGIGSGEGEDSTTNDPYLKDHVYRGEQIFPGVMGLEAMAQVGIALLETSETPSFEDVKFNRPVVVPKNDTLKIRLAALVQESGKIEVVLRSEQTAFSVDHFRATIIPSQTDPQPLTVANLPRESQIPHTLNPQEDIYGEILFHKGRFQRLHRYLHLKAQECVAEIKPEVSSSWFSHYLPQDLVLGDPGARDATIHTLQACIPHATILPTGVERLVRRHVSTSTARFILAQERQRRGDTFIYDVQVTDGDGSVLEIWEGLQLQIIKYRNSQDTWAETLLPPLYLRRVR